MQPTLIISAPIECMVYINGRFAGEARPDAPLLTPVNAFGAIYLEFRPLCAGFLSTARRIVLSGGRLIAESFAAAKGLIATLWPDNVTEIEWLPEALAVEPDRPVQLDGLSCRLTRSTPPHLEIGTLSVPLPEKSGPPELRRLNGVPVLNGPCVDGQYLLTLSPDASRRTGFTTADRFEFEEPDSILAVTGQKNKPGPAVLEHWTVDGTGLRLLSSEPLSQRPVSAEETVLAATEAALSGRFVESDSYLSPALRKEFTLEAIGQICESCRPMRYASPGTPPCIALLHPETENLFSVRPLYYRAERTDGDWQLTWLSLDYPE